MSAELSTGIADPAWALAEALAPALAPLPVAPGRQARLQQMLAQRIHRSAMAHRPFSTVRREDCNWAEISPGVRQRTLSAAGGLCADLLQVQAHAAIPWPQDDLAQELLVIDGALRVQPAGAPVIALPPRSQVVLGRAGAPGLSAGSAGLTLYRRRRSVGLSQLPAGEARWWATAEAAPLAAAGPASPWANFITGVDAAVLRADDDVASMLVRIAPGANLPDHGHSQAEDCFVLEGEMFLGDILMRAGDYQLAPAGCQHVGIASDLGCLFYFHGAVPPAASE